MGEQPHTLLVGVAVEVVDPVGVEARGAADDPVHLVSLLQKQLGEVGAVLPGDAGDQRLLRCLRHDRDGGYRGILPAGARPRRLTTTAVVPNSPDALTRRTPHLTRGALRRAFPRPRPTAIRPQPMLERPVRSVAIMHLPEVSGPSRSLENELEWLAGRGQLEVFLPGDGRLAARLRSLRSGQDLGYSTLTVPERPERPDRRHSAGSVGRLAACEAAIRRAQPDLVIVTSALLPSALLAASIEDVPSILYAGEILDEPRVASGPRALAGKALLQLAARSATTIIACSDRVARQYTARGGKNVATIHPPIGSRYARATATDFAAPTGSRLIRPDRRSRRDHPWPGPGRTDSGAAHDPAVSPDVQLAIVGEPHPRELDGEYARNVARLATRSFREASPSRGSKSASRMPTRPPPLSLTPPAMRHSVGWRSRLDGRPACGLNLDRGGTRAPAGRC